MGGKIFVLTLGERYYFSKSTGGVLTPSRETTFAPGLAETFLFAGSGGKARDRFPRNASPAILGSLSPRPKPTTKDRSGM
jgi:hypothetical protein